MTGSLREYIDYLIKVEESYDGEAALYLDSGTGRMWVVPKDEEDDCMSLMLPDELPAELVERIERF
jgi:hypothetical protein